MISKPFDKCKFAIAATSSEKCYSHLKLRSDQKQRNISIVSLDHNWIIASFVRCTQSAEIRSFSGGGDWPLSVIIMADLNIISALNQLWRSLT